MRIKSPRRTRCEVGNSYDESGLCQSGLCNCYDESGLCTVVGNCYESGLCTVCNFEKLHKQYSVSNPKNCSFYYPTYKTYLTYNLQ